MPLRMGNPATGLGLVQPITQQIAVVLSPCHTLKFSSRNNLSSTNHAVENHDSTRRDDLEPKFGWIWPRSTDDSCCEQGTV